MSNRLVSKNIISKTIVSKSGKTLGVVSDIIFETRTGELIYLIIDKPTSYSKTFDLEVNKEGQYQIPFSSVLAIGDFIVIQEEDLG
jgi:sporulation protein YlmC with PRC-barrel domain